MLNIIIKLPMNKILSTLSIFGMIAVCCFLQSCTNDANQEDESVSHYPKIITDLEKINEELLLIVPQGTRWGSWNKEEKMKVVVSDLLGALGGAKAGLSFGAKAGLGVGAPHLVGGGFCLLGALVGGAYGSWMAAPTRSANDVFPKIQRVCKVIVKDDLTLNRQSVIVKNDYVDNKINVSPVLLKETRLDANSLNVALMHNIVLSTLDGSVTIKESVGEMADDVKYVNEMLNSEEFMDSCRSVGYRAQNFEFGSCDELTTKIIQLFDKVLEAYASKTDDVAFIIGKYMEVIESSMELTDEQKECIRYGLATALYSSNYWDKRYDEILN